MEKIEVIFAGYKQNAIYAHSLVEGLDTFQLIIPIKQGNYFGCVAITSFIEDISEDLAGHFYSL